MHKFTFPLSFSISKGPLELIHSDVWGPSHVPSMKWNALFLTLY
jgi:hypothetical protein